MSTTIKTLLIFSIFFVSCQPNKNKIVKEFIDLINKFDETNCLNYLTEDFLFVGEKDTVDRKEYLNSIRDSKKFESKYILTSLQENDSTVIAQLLITNIYDSLLQVEPKMRQRRTFYFKNNKINKIQIDTIFHHKEYLNSYKQKQEAFILYLKENYSHIEDSLILRNIKSYLKEFYDLPENKKREILLYSKINGTYISNDNKFYKKLIFKGRTTVIIVDAIFGFSFASSYVLDENLIRIKTDKSDLLLEIAPNNKLIGVGFASGTFTKIN